MPNGEISYYQGRFLQLATKYQYVCGLDRENPVVAKLLHKTPPNSYEDRYAVYMDTENGTLVFTHQTVVSIGAASTDRVEYAQVISFDMVRELLAYEIDLYTTLVARWEQEQDESRATLCKTRLCTLQKIVRTDATNWRNLLRDK